VSGGLVLSGVLSPFISGTLTRSRPRHLTNEEARPLRFRRRRRRFPRDRTPIAPPPSKEKPMNKIRLELDTLAVESFSTTPTDAESRGTVHGHRPPFTQGLECASEVCETEGCATYATDCGTCAATACGTCATNCGTCYDATCGNTYCGTCDPYCCCSCSCC
jgi:hypothetical protein